MERSEQVVAIVRACQASCGNGKSPACRDLTKKVSAILDQGDTTVREVRERLKALHVTYLNPSAEIFSDGSGYVRDAREESNIEWSGSDNDRLMLVELDEVIAERFRKAEQQTDREEMARREPSRCVDVVRGCAECNCPTGDIKVEIVSGPPPDGCIEPNPPARPVPRWESPDGESWRWVDERGVFMFDRAVNPTGPERSAITVDEMNSGEYCKNWRYIGPVNDGDLDPDSVPEQQADPVAEFRAALDEAGVEDVQVQSLEDAMAESAFADITPPNVELLAKAKDPPTDWLDEPANDPRLSEIMEAIGGSNYKCEVYGGGMWAVVDCCTLEAIADNNDDPDPVTAIRRLTTPKPEPVDPMQELLRHVDNYTNDLEVAGEDSDSDFVHIGIHKRRLAELVAAADAARKALEGKP